VIWIAIPMGIVAALVFWPAIDRFLYVPGHDTEPLDPRNPLNPSNLQNNEGA
jgi:hypothetical protein